MANIEETKPALPPRRMTSITNTNVVTENVIAEETKPALPPRTRRTTSLSNTTEVNGSATVNPRYSPQPPSKLERPRPASVNYENSKPSTPPVKQRKPMPPPKPSVYDNDDSDDGEAATEETDGLLKSLGHPHKGRTKSPSLDRIGLTYTPTLIKVGEVLQLAEFVRKYSRDLPLRVRVQEGYCGAEERFVISTGDTYNLHFIKNEKVVTIQDCGGANFAIPLNSSIEFGLLYDPVNDFKQAVKGYIFKTVSELTKYKVHPLVIKSSKAFDSGDPKTSVQDDEVLIVQKTGKTPMKRKHFIKVVNVKTGEEKTLYEDCEGHFLTGPYNVRLYLPEILKYFGDNFPLDAMLYSDSQSPDKPSDDLPPHLTTDKVVLTHTSIESSIIASTCWELGVGAEPSGEDQIPVAIPINLDIEIAILEEYEDDQLYRDTKTLFETFDPLKIKTMEPPSETGTTSSAQKRLFRATRSGIQSVVEISRPSKIYDVPVLPEFMLGGDGKMSEPDDRDRPVIQPSLGEVLARKPALPYLSSISKSTSTPVQNGTPAGPIGGSNPVKSSVPPPVSRKSYERQRPSLPDKDTQQKPSVKTKPYEGASIISHSTSDVSSHDQKVASVILSESYPSGSSSTSPPAQFSDLYSQMRSLKSLVDATQDNARRQMSGLRTEVVRVSTALEDMKEKYQTLLAEVQQLRTELATSRHHDNSGRPHPQPHLHPTLDSNGHRGESVVVTEAQMEENRRFLESLDHVQILNVLEAMHLRAYLDVFREELIDGAILLECDNEVLEHELHITNKLHRSKIMKLITGKYSAAKILETGDPYVSFHPSY